MKREYGLAQIEKDPSSVVTVGSFDGVHAGHRAILRYLIRRAKEQQGQSVVVTFDPHPREVLYGHAVPLLNTIDERADILEGLGLDRFIVIEFSEAFSKLTPETFIEKILVGHIGMQEIVVGYDHGFGKGRQGNSDLLKRVGKTHGFTVDIIPAQEVAHHVVSSTEIRHLLVEEGDAQTAADMLGHHYSLSGTVIHGDGRGHSIGFPTANIQVDHPRKLIPRRGVYAVQVRLAGENCVRGGMMNIGLRPTFNGTRQWLEVHIFDFNEDIYDAQLRIEFVERIRDERKFGSVEELVEQLSKDERRSRRTLELLS
ncbi:MAG: bifunctional riboflavin kinase/FAD synthetase [Rhodothermales bacterium]